MEYIVKESKNRLELISSEQKINQDCDTNDVVGIAGKPSKFYVPSLPSNTASRTKNFSINASDYRVSIDIDDVEPGFLFDKLTAGHGIILEKICLPGAVPVVRITNIGLSTDLFDALVTVADGDIAFTGNISNDAEGSDLLVFVNGLSVNIANGLAQQATAPCYFESLAGGTIRAYGEVISTDVLHWNGSVAGYQLDTTDEIEILYI